MTFNCLNTYHDRRVLLAVHSDVFFVCSPQVRYHVFGSVAFLTYACVPSTASNVWYRKSPMAQEAYTHFGISWSSVGLYHSNVKKFRTTKLNPDIVIYINSSQWIRFGLGKKVRETTHGIGPVVVSHKHVPEVWGGVMSALLTPLTLESIWWPHGCRMVWGHSEKPGNGQHRRTCRDGGLQDSSAEYTPLWQTEARERYWGLGAMGKKGLWVSTVESKKFAKFRFRVDAN